MIHRFLLTLACLTLLAPAALASLQVPPPSDLTARNYVIMDHLSGMVLAESDADARVEPASLTKIMTAYLVFQELARGNIDLEEEVRISEQAWRTGMTGASRMYIEVNNRVKVEDLLRGMIVQSGNDACVALAEHVAGTEGAFVDVMNAQARALGMTNTRFTNSHGLPSEESQYTSARDMAKLAQALIRDFPEYYRYYSERSFTFNDITQSNRNLLLWRDSHVDGLKTGWTRAAGYNLVSSREQDGMRLIAVVMGIDAPNHQQGGIRRANESQALYSWGFRQFETHKLYDAGEVITEARVWKGESDQVPLALAEDLYVSVPSGRYNALQARMELDARLEAPVREGETYGEVQLVLDGEVLLTRPLVAMSSVEEGGLFRRLWDTVLMMF
ncbi:serine-type D-Ala-D-Ala carboxypeptidase [Thioalkalivibrio denitrificans]|uniref:serine-type D-Ala-D-Ala carboxypeptidase n=1 Tax=Thioalkalivibrio denitrificans TaxID=108003 RepID=A0A1V3NI18_9GAMM|nr:D-alanyl-D-alanine carboxypeptidase family protein [Thioalkalivibrio denitrificans]OOG24757.1 serine-type D-Ala-D-Ala carboxypeptidase [Thioalkalivibrio denitrificans]